MFPPTTSLKDHDDLLSQHPTVTSTLTTQTYAYAYRPGPIKVKQDHMFGRVP